MLFSCLGTTLKAAGSKDKQWYIDYQIPLQFAQIAKRNGVPPSCYYQHMGHPPIAKYFIRK